MSSRVPFLLLALGGTSLALPVACSANPAHRAPDGALEARTPMDGAWGDGARVRRDVEALASDAMAGRRAATAGAHAAARYLADALAEAGVQPAGDDGTFLQAVDLVQTEHHQPPRLALELTDGARLEGVHGVDFSLSLPGSGARHLTDGFGSGEPVRLEVVTVRDLSEPAPRAAGDRALFVDATRRRVAEWLGEVGEPGGAGWGLLVRAGSSRPGKGPTVPRGGLTPVGGEGGENPGSLTLRGRFGERLEAGDVRALELVLDASRSLVVDYNVLGILPGERADEAVVLSAHYDHLGVREALPEDESDADLVYNGADDDASGVAAVLALARAFGARGGEVRTLVFLLAGAEEVGLLGTRHYLEHPAVGLDRTVANLNFEMIGRPDELAGGKGHLWLTGFERSTLGDRFRAAGLPVVPDPRPEQMFFRRSDNYPFAVRGVVAQTLSSFGLHDDYHHVTDEIETLDFEHLASACRTAFRAAELLATGELDPEWHPGMRP